MTIHRQNESMLPRSATVGWYVTNGTKKPHELMMHVAFFVLFAWFPAI